MASDLEKKAKEAFLDDNFELSVDLCTQAINIDPNNADLYADRAQANIKLKNYTEAIADANRAIELDSTMAKAYLRKATACMKLEEYQTAKAALEAGASLVPSDSRFTNLMKECNDRIAEETGDITMHLAPSTPPSAVTPVESHLSDGTENDSVLGQKIPQTLVIPAKPKYRHEYYQKPEVVVVTIFAKGVPSKNVSIEFGEQILSVTIDIPGEDPYVFQPRLFGKIIPEKCRYDVLSTKVEIRLAKTEAINWTSLEYCREITITQKINAPAVGGTGTALPTYPSSKPKGVDWDKLEAQVKKEEKEEKLEGDAALNKLFRDIYQDADEDTRRAMKKSFVESNGTVLSTNWKEVGAKKVQSTPPDSMELKKWEY